MRQLRKPIEYARNFANFSRTHELQPNDLAELVADIETAARENTRAANGEKNWAGCAQQLVEHQAKKMRLRVVDWDLYPSIVKHGDTTHIFIPLP